MDDRNDVPYESALDLPSMQKMLRDISGAKALTRFVARDKRADIIAIEVEIRRLGEAVDGFYALLGDRNWIYRRPWRYPISGRTTWSVWRWVCAVRRATSPTSTAPLSKHSSGA